MGTMNGDFTDYTDLADFERMISEPMIGQDQNHMMHCGPPPLPPHNGMYSSMPQMPQDTSQAAVHRMMNGHAMHNMPLNHHHHLMQPMTPLPPDPPPRTQRQADDSEPWVEITEQPRQRGLRFRYQCEGRSAGSIPGENSTNEKKTFPTIKIHNYRGQAIIVVSCVTKEPQPKCKPHPHSLVGRDCKKGVCTVKVKDACVVSFPQLGIQCAKKKDVEDALKLRKEINVDPFQSGFDHVSSNIDLNVVRLCFQVFLPDVNGKVTRVVPPVVSLPIHDKKALNDLIICRVDKSSGKAQGGDEVFLLCEKVGKEDIKVRFFEEKDGETVWEGFADFGQGDVHRQYAIVFKTPKYKEDYISQAVHVNMQLFRPSDSEGSDPIQFTYMPDDPDPDRIAEKRRRKGDWLNKVMPSSGSSEGPSSTSSSVKESLRHMLKANRRIKKEPQASGAQGAACLQGASMSSRGSLSSMEPLSSTSASQPPPPRDSSQAPLTTSTQPTLPSTSTVDTNRMMQQFVLQQQLLQQQQQQQQTSEAQTSLGGQVSVAGGQMSVSEAHVSMTSCASGGSQTVSLEESLLNMVTMPTSTLISNFDMNTFQALLEHGVSLSSGDGGSTNMADPSISHDLSAAAIIPGQMVDPALQPQHEDFLQVQAALASLNKS